LNLTYVRLLETMAYIMMEDKQNSIDEKKDSGANPYLLAGSVIVAGVLIAGAVIYSNSGKLQRVEGPKKEAAGVGLAKDKETPAVSLVDDDPVLGNPNAPVTIVEFGDFQCSFCGRFFKTTITQIKESYVKNGDVKIVYRDFPLSSIHPMAEKAAEAAECANEQKKFWQYHDKLYENQESLSVDNFKVWAKDFGLDSDRFNKCLDSGKYADEIKKDFNDGVAAGVQGTPASFINGRFIEGAVPFEQFQSVIESELKKVR